VMCVEVLHEEGECAGTWYGKWENGKRGGIDLGFSTRTGGRTRQRGEMGTLCREDDRMNGNERDSFFLRRRDRKINRRNMGGYVPAHVTQNNL